MQLLLPQDAGGLFAKINSDVALTTITSPANQDVISRKSWSKEKFPYIYQKTRSKCRFLQI